MASRRATDTSLTPASLGPQLDGRFYIKWFDQWATKSTHQSCSTDTKGFNKIISDVDRILAANNFINMLHVARRH